MSRANSHLVPAHYIRRQTLKNNERYIIDEAEEIRGQVLTAQAQALALEKRLYEELLDALLPHLGDLQESAAALAELDVLANLAERAETLDYRCPTLIDEDQIPDRGGPPSGGGAGDDRPLYRQPHPAGAGAADADHHRPQHGR